MHAWQCERVHLAGDRTRVGEPCGADQLEGLVRPAPFGGVRSLEEHRTRIEQRRRQCAQIRRRVHPWNSRFVPPHRASPAAHRDDGDIGGNLAATDQIAQQFTRRETVS